MKIYDILFPTDNKYKGAIHLVILNKNKEIKSLGFSYAENLTNRIEDLKIMSNVNYYLTANATYPFKDRKAENLSYLQNIVIDCDIHKRLNGHERELLLDEFVWRLKRDLFGTNTDYQIPMPNIIHYTGRGIQLWWNIKQCSKKLLFLYRQIIDDIIFLISDFLNEYPTLKSFIEIDTVASKNPIGLFRMFETYNTHTQTKSKIEVLHQDGIDINDFNNRINTTYQITERNHNKLIKLANKRKKTFSAAKGIDTKKRNGYINLHRKRMALIEYLINERETVIGYRDKMLFLYFNAAIQCTTRERATEKTISINASFDIPLNKIQYIFKEIATPYKFTNKTVNEWLEITESERIAFETVYRKQSVNASRNEQTRINKQIKAEKAQKAKDLLKDGKHTQKQIAEILELSASTISKIAKTVPKSITKCEPWRELGMSRATYYRHKQNRVS